MPTHRRVRLPGFPLQEKFTTPEEIKEYFSSDLILCLQCGRSFDRLAKHLKVEHAMSVEEYKDYYGLPWDRGLVGAQLRRLMAETIRRQPPRPLPPPSDRRPYRPRQPFHDELSARALSLIPKRPNDPSAHERLLEALERGMTLRQITRRPDMPSLQSHYLYRQQNRDYDRKVKMILTQVTLRGRRRPT